jgi:hypothetical protein
LQTLITKNVKFASTLVSTKMQMITMILSAMTAVVVMSFVIGASGLIGEHINVELKHNSSSGEELQLEHLHQWQILE